MCPGPGREGTVLGHKDGSSLAGGTGLGPWLGEAWASGSPGAGARRRVEACEAAMWQVLANGCVPELCCCFSSRILPVPGTLSCLLSRPLPQPFSSFLIITSVRCRFPQLPLSRTVTTLNLPPLPPSLGLSGLCFTPLLALHLLLVHRLSFAPFHFLLVPRTVGSSWNPPSAEPGGVQATAPPGVLEPASIAIAPQS